MRPPDPFSTDGSFWMLAPGVDFLNHGSFGSCPRPVLEYQSALREEMEASPVEFLVRSFDQRIDAARGVLARFAGADPAGLVFVSNATTAVNIALAGLGLKPGDEILVTDHTYPACLNAVRHAAAQAGARVVVAPVPFPLRGEEQVLEALFVHLTPRTRAALVDHVTSPTGLVFPLERINRHLEARGVLLIADGAHALGMLPLALDDWQPAYYTANAHKWLCAPKGSAFLWVREDRREGLHPLVISHGYARPPQGRSRLHLEFDWTGTADPTAWLAVPRAIEALGAVFPGGWPELMARNRGLARRARRILLEALSLPEPCPETMLGALASVILPSALAGPGAAAAPEGWVGRFRERHRLEPCAFAWPDERQFLLRVSAQLYNTEEQYRRLARLLAAGP